MQSECSLTAVVSLEANAEALWLRIFKLCVIILPLSVGQWLQVWLNWAFDSRSHPAIAQTRAISLDAQMEKELPPNPTHFQDCSWNLVLYSYWNHFLKDWFIFYLYRFCLHLCVCAPPTQYTWRPDEVLGSPGLVMNGWELTCGCWEPKLEFCKNTKYLIFWARTPALSYWILEALQEQQWTFYFLSRTIFQSNNKKHSVLSS